MGWVVNATPRPLYCQQRDAVPILQEAGWAPEPVWTGEKNLAPTEIGSPDRSESLTYGICCMYIYTRIYRIADINLSPRLFPLSCAVCTRSWHYADPFPKSLRGCYESSRPQGLIHACWGSKAQNKKILKWPSYWLSSSFTTLKHKKKIVFFRSVLVLCSTKVLEFCVLAHVKASPEDGWWPLYNFHG
jgi:hypothetical protein